MPSSHNWDDFFEEISLPEIDIQAEAAETDYDRPPCLNSDQFDALRHDLAEPELGDQPQGP